MKRESLARIARFVLQRTECRCGARILGGYEDGTLLCPHGLAQRLLDEVLADPEASEKVALREALGSLGLCFRDAFRDPAPVALTRYEEGWERIWGKRT